MAANVDDKVLCVHVAPEKTSNLTAAHTRLTNSVDGRPDGEITGLFQKLTELLGGKRLCFRCGDSASPKSQRNRTAEDEAVVHRRVENGA